MKFLHLGDLHLGKTLGDFDLTGDQEYILKQILEIVKEEKADAVLIAGDVYDKAIPSEAAVRLLDEFLRSLAGLGVWTFLISGNHDSDERLNFGSSLFEANRICISAVFNGVLYKKTLTDEYGEINIYLLPFVKASQVRHFYPDAPIRSYEDAVRTVLQNAQIDPEKRNVLVAHQFVAGHGEDPVFGGSEGLPVQNVGQVEKIGADCFDAFDYVALGHIHAPQRVGRDEVRYAGSPLKYSLSEVRNDKSAPVVTLKEKGQADIDLHSLRPLRDLRHLKGPLEKLLSSENICSTEDFIYATLTDEDMTRDVIHIFRQVYPNTVRIDYDNSHTREMEHADFHQEIRTRSFQDQIADFYRQIYSCEISSEEMGIICRAAKDAGIPV